MANPLHIEKLTLVKLLHAAILLAVSLSYLSYVFHHTFWRSGLGDWIDPYFINYLLEHWYHSVSTLSDPSSPPCIFRCRRRWATRTGSFCMPLFTWLSDRFSIRFRPTA
ncbi:MAG: hypothetical protein M3P18_09220 [Actinomycetota bacterium]|nr:hypothetical protein [Actinomycetota bacterium]